MAEAGTLAFERVRLARPVPPTLGVGSILKNTVCLAAGSEALVSPPLGNLDNVEAVRAFEAAVGELIRQAGVRPRMVCHDLHPDYFGTRFAMGAGVETLPVQHHHAHVAAVMAEHGRVGPTLGLALDGFGLGTDNAAWGGELLLVDGNGFRRLGHLRALKQPGGDMAAREPWRMAAAVLHELGRDGEIAVRFSSQPGAGVVTQMLARGVNSPATTSCGRLFDAAAALSGVKLVAENEAAAPVALEAACERPQVAVDGWRLKDGVLDLLPVLAAMIGRPTAEASGLFHGTLVAAMTEWVAWAVEATGVREVAFSGGCFFNRVLREGLKQALAERGMAVLQPVKLSPGDPAISLGQVWAAGLMDKTPSVSP